MTPILSKVAVPLVEVTRGSITECIHRGNVVVVNNKGKILYKAGDAFYNTYFRSAAKPVQALNVLKSGASDRFGFTDKQLAVMCSSHYAEPIHIETINEILAKIGLEHTNIKGGVVTSLNAEYALKLAYDKVKLNSLFSDCSGKHAGMLAVCKHQNYSLKNYLSANHPCQQDILSIISEICQIEVENINIGIDGCSAPVHAMPIYNMALCFARLANPDEICQPMSSYCNRIFNAMTNYPEMISGTGGFCTELIKHASKKLIGKVGAEGVYCVGVKDMNIGIAVKIESGSMAMLPPVIYKIINELNILNESEKLNLKKYKVMDNLNDIETKVGEIRPAFELEEVLK